MLILVRYMLKFLQVNCADPDLMLLSVSSNLCLHFMPTSKNMGLYANIGLGFIP